MKTSVGDERKTIDDVIDGIGFGRFHVLVILQCGLIQASDMLEIQYVSMVSQHLQCVWWISDYWKSFITSGTFLGLLVGAYAWSPLGDKHCRRSVTALCMGFIFTYGCLTSLAPNVIWVVLLRFLSGSGIGGVLPLSSTMMSEFMPSNYRGMAWFIFEGLWCLGGLMEIGMAWLLLDLENGWRYLAICTSLPMLLLGIPWLAWLPQSPRQTLLQGELAVTRKTLNRMADTNGKPRYLGDFDMTDLQGKHKRGSIVTLLRPDTYLRMSLQLALIYFAGAFCYYGMILLNVQVPLLLRHQCNTTTEAKLHRGLDRYCHSCEPFNYVELLIPTFADIGTALVSAFILERLLGRRIIMAVSFCLAALLFPLLSFCMDSSARIALFFIIRFLVSTGYNVIGLYVLEVYPTNLRSTASGFMSSFGRVASVLVPFVAQIFLRQVSLLGGLLIFSVLLIGATVSAALLPLETKDRPLAQTAAPIPLASPPGIQDDLAREKDEAAPVLRADSGGDNYYGSIGPSKAD